MTTATRTVINRDDEWQIRSQNGEDGVIAAILDKLPVARVSFVEFGAGDGHENNCASLAEAGHHGVFIEGDEAKADALFDRYTQQSGVVPVHARVDAHTVEPIFKVAGVADDVTVMSIDIDGNDYWVWQAIQQWRPLLVVIEYNAALGQRCCVQPYDPDWQWDQTVYFGASLPALNKLAREKGYSFLYAEHRGVNAFFIRDDHAHLFELPAQLPVIKPCYKHKPDPRGRTYVDVA